MLASRDPDRYMPYVLDLLLYTANIANIIKEQVPDGQPHIFYMDIRSDARAMRSSFKKPVEEKGLLI